MRDHPDDAVAVRAATGSCDATVAGCGTGARAGADSGFEFDFTLSAALRSIALVTDAVCAANGGGI